MALPTLTPEQRDAALAEARETRQARSALLEQVKTGETTIAQIIDRGQSDLVAGKIKVTQLVRALPATARRRPTPCCTRWASTRDPAARRAAHAVGRD